MDDTSSWPTQRDALDWDDYDRRAHAGPHDDAALALWLWDHGREKEAREVIEHLAGLSLGTHQNQLRLALGD